MMIPTVIKVFLSDNPSDASTEVPITPNTTASDVIQICREPGETNCHLAEIWRGNERVVSAGEKPYTILHQWGSCAPEVKFYLRHHSKQTPEPTGKYWPNQTPANMNHFKDISLAEMKDLAKRQQQQIEQQEQMLVGKEQRLRFLRQQAQQQQAVVGENERLKRLREKAEAQETKLKKIRSMRGKLEQRRTDNTTLSVELDAVRALFSDKQQELSKAVAKVNDLTRQLDDLRNSKLSNNVNGNQNDSNGFGGGAKQQNGVSELDKLRKELSILNQMNEEQQRRLNEQRNSLRKRNEDASDLDRRIEELMEKLRKKKAATGGNSTSENQWERERENAYNTPPNKMHTIVAAVEPLKHNTANDNTADTDSVALKLGNNSINQQYYNQTRNQPDETNLNKQSSKEILSSNQQTNETNRPQSAMAQLFPTNTFKSESLTAKVRPIFAKGNQPQPNPAQNNANNNANPATGINLFQYKPPPPASTASATSAPYMPNITVLPSGNIKYTQPPAGHPPPPYPSGSYSGRPYSLTSPDRNIAIDIEALRRKFAHAPRPLKKRSSISEPAESAPNIPKFIYDHIYKKADTPFYRPHSESGPQPSGGPPPAYVAPVPQEANTASPMSPIVIPEGAVNYEHNISPTAYLKKQQQNLKKITTAIQKSKEVQDDKERDSSSQDHLSIDDNLSDLSSESNLPAIKVPQYPYDKVPGKSNLKRHDYVSKGNIRFDPLALLLDASLEGEFKLVQNIIDQVKDPSGANDEGITALHNAVCAGHFDLVRFLVHYGSDINASDTDGWTPLHCAASCNNLPMAKFLVENGACIYATTISDGETAADKCEELDEGYIACSEYLYGIQDKFGFVNKGQVFALYDYKVENDDEISFNEGEIMTVIRRGDEEELEWWWARKQDKEGYIPRNLLGMWPRIKRNHKGSE